MIDRKLLKIGGICGMVFVVVMIAALAYFMAALGPPTPEVEETLLIRAGAPEALRWFGWAMTLVGVLLVPFSLALCFVLWERERTYALLGLVFLLFIALGNLISRVAPIPPWTGRWDRSMLPATRPRKRPC